MCCHHLSGKVCAGLVCVQVCVHAKVGIYPLCLIAWIMVWILTSTWMTVSNSTTFETSKGPGRHIDHLKGVGVWDFPFSKVCSFVFRQVLAVCFLASLVTAMHAHSKSCLPKGCWENCKTFCCTRLRTARCGNLGYGFLQETSTKNRKTSRQILGKTSIGHAVDSG